MAFSEAPLTELDRIRLKKPISAKGRSFALGLLGTVVYGHGTAAYAIEFPGISDIFQIPAAFLEKA
jgi:hypothetical protein